MARSSLWLTRSLVAALIAVSWASVPLARLAASDKLEYSLRPDQTVAYRIEITADREDATETLQGVITYKCTYVETGILDVTYSGGLVKSSIAKPSQDYSRFGPSRFGARFGPSRAFGPFSETPFKGLITTTNHLTLTSLGEVQTMQGDSQLPYLLGNASLLIFEPLPKQPRESWSVTAGISITEEGGRQGLPYRFPFERDPPRRTTTGSEILTYQVRTTEGPHIIVDKTYRLDSPALSKDVSGFEINGTGTWTFNHRLGISESLQFGQKLIVQKGNTTTVIPMTIKYNRMSDAELQEYREEQKRKAEEAKRQFAELEKKKASTPLTEMEIQKFLEELKSDNAAVVLGALQRIQGRTPECGDLRIAGAIHALREHENVLVRRNAEAAAGKWPYTVGWPPERTRIRIWSDSTGTFTIVAEFLALVGDTVRLKRNDGVEVEIPMAKLSETDQKVVRDLVNVSSNPVVENPFK